MSKGKLVAGQLDLVRRDVGLYADVSKSWNNGHEQAMACYGFEDVLQRGVFLFDVIVRLDERWRRDVYRAKVEYSPTDAEAIHQLFVDWHRPCAKVLDQLEAFERAGLDVKWAREFRARCREAEGILTPDARFFADDALVRLRDEALDQHKEGQTLEYGPT